MDDESLRAMEKAPMVYCVSEQSARADLVGRIFHAMREVGESSERICER